VNHDRWDAIRLGLREQVVLHDQAKALRVAIDGRAQGRTLSASGVCPQQTEWFPSAVRTRKCRSSRVRTSWRLTTGPKRTQTRRSRASLRRQDRLVWQSGSDRVGAGGPLGTLCGSLVYGPLPLQKKIPPTILGTLSRPPLVTRRSRCGSRRLGARRDRRRVRP